MVQAIAALKAANLTLRFLLELAALAAVAYWGAQAGGSRAADIMLAIAAPVLLATTWGLFAAPKAPRRLADPARLLFEAIFFALAAAGLVAAGKAGLAGIFLVLTLSNALLVRAWGEPEARK